jgi:cytochrome c oxidase subunit 2
MNKRFLSWCVLGVLLAPGLMLQARGDAKGEPRKIEVIAKRYSFTPGDITLKKGEPVLLVLKSVDVPHGIRIRELGVEVKVPKAGTQEVRFTPAKTGTFVGHCYVFCGEGHGSMTLTLHVID